MAMDEYGQVRAESRQPLPPPTSPRPGWSEQDAGSWWPAVAAALAEVTGAVARVGRVVAVSVCATSGTVVALDRHGEPIGPALTYADQRAVAEAEVAQAAGSARWAALGLRVQASFGLPKWAWLVADRGSAVATLGHASDVVVRRLVAGGRGGVGLGGAPVPTDWSHALKSGFDPLRQEWAMEAMEALGIRRRPAAGGAAADGGGGTGRARRGGRHRPPDRVPGPAGDDRRLRRPTGGGRGRSRSVHVRPRLDPRPQGGLAGSWWSTRPGPSTATATRRAGGCRGVRRARAGGRCWRAFPDATRPSSTTSRRPRPGHVRDISAGGTG